MSHFTVMVIGNDPESQLAPFDESIEMPRYVKYTKEQLIEKAKKWNEDYKNGTYAEYLENPVKYAENCGNVRHLEYLKTEFPLKLKMTDEELYQNEIEGYDPDEISPEGGVYSTYNPKSKWDWYELGGRWQGMIKTKDGKSVDEAIKSEIANLDEICTFAVLKDGEWYERGKMGWWAIVSDEDAEWEVKQKELIASLPDDAFISIYDCHI